MRITITVGDDDATVLEVSADAVAAVEAWRMSRGPAGVPALYETVSAALAIGVYDIIRMAVASHPPEALRIAREAAQEEEGRVLGRPAKGSEEARRA